MKFWLGGHAPGLLGFLRIQYGHQYGSRTGTNLYFVIYFVLNTIYWWCWHLHVCFWGCGIRSHFNLLRQTWWRNSKMYAKIAI